MYKNFIHIIILYGISKNFDNANDCITNFLPISSSIQTNTTHESNENITDEITIINTIFNDPHTKFNFSSHLHTSSHNKYIFQIFTVNIQPKNEHIHKIIITTPNYPNPDPEIDPSPRGTYKSTPYPNTGH